ncbi:S27A3 protein, partial [Columbina picui]|nr:S27A3 protein [Columbina picui]
MAALVLRPGCRLDGTALHRHLERLLPPYARPRFLRLQVPGCGDTGGDVGLCGDPPDLRHRPQEQLEMTQTFKQQKVRLAREGCDPAQVPAPLFVLDEAAGAYVPMGPALWERVLDGRLRI